MVFDRNKWKGASLSANKEVSKKTDELTKTPGSGDRPGFHTVKEGTNIFRICPPHNQSDPSFQPKVTVWMPREIEETDKDGKKTGKKIIANRPVFNSRVHGGTDKDIIEEYCNFVYKQVKDTCQDKEEIATKLAPINGWRGKDKKWNAGIRYSTAYVFYAFSNSVLARLELWKKDKDRMEELNISEEADEPIATDCFSDPNEGVSLIIVREKDEKGQMGNVLKKREFNGKKHKTWDDFIASEALTDEQLIELEKAPSLTSLYKNSYKRSDFEIALEGLRIFDEKNNFDVFANDEFLDVCEEISNYYPETEEKNSEDSEEEEETPKSKVKVETKKTDKFDKMDRTELKAYIRQGGLSITVMKGMSDDAIRVLIRENDNPEVEIEDEEEIPKASIKEKEVKKQEPQEVEETGDLPWEKEDENKQTAQSAKDKIAAMKAKYNKNK